MPQYLVANYLPDDFDPSTVTEAMIEEIHAVNRELIAAGVRKFACGISPAANAKTVRKQSDGKVLVTDGPYTETKEHMGGFWILECSDLEEALAWARSASFFSSRLRNQDPRVASKQPSHCGPRNTRYREREERAGAMLWRRFAAVRYEEKNHEIHLFGVLRQK